MNTGDNFWDRVKIAGNYNNVVGDGKGTKSKIFKVAGKEISVNGMNTAEMKKVLNDAIKNNGFTVDEKVATMKRPALEQAFCKLIDFTFPDLKNSPAETYVKDGKKAAAAPKPKPVKVEAKKVVVVSDGEKSSNESDDEASEDASDDDGEEDGDGDEEGREAASDSECDDESEEMCLKKTIRADDYDKLQNLLNNGFSADKALEIAIAEENAEFADLIMSDYEPANLEECLLQAVTLNNFEIVNLFMENENIENVNDALMINAEVGGFEITELLLQKNPDNIEDAIEMAASVNNTDVLNFLQAQD